MVFLFILEHTMMPLFTLVLIGFLVDRKFHIAVKTMSKFMFYLVVPSFIFTNIYTTDFPSNSINIIACVAIFMVICLLLANGISKWRHYDAGMLESCRNALMFNNTGNLGVAMIILVFSHEPFVVNGQTPYLAEAMVVQIIIFVIQSCTLNTIGLYQAGRGRLSARDTLKVIFQMPIVYVFVAAILCRVLNLDAKDFYFWPIMEMAAKAITPVAMFTIGIQLSQTKIDWFDREVWIVSFLKFFHTACHRPGHDFHCQYPCSRYIHGRRSYRLPHLLCYSDRRQYGHVCHGIWQQSQLRHPGRHEHDSAQCHLP